MVSIAPAQCHPQRRFNFFILSDDVYQLLDWSEGCSPPRLLEYDPSFQRHTACTASRAASREPIAEPPEDDVYAAASAGPGKRPKLSGSAEAINGEAIIDGLVVSVGSFTKILAPGLRLGWLEARAALAHATPSDPGGGFGGVKGLEGGVRGKRCWGPFGSVISRCPRHSPVLSHAAPPRCPVCVLSRRRPRCFNASCGVAISPRVVASRPSLPRS